MLRSARENKQGSIAQETVKCEIKQLLRPSDDDFQSSESIFSGLRKVNGDYSDLLPSELLKDPSSKHSYHS